MLRKWWFLLPVVLVPFLEIAIFNFAKHAPPAKDNSLESKLFIVANPLDLAQIQTISKFRSCVGHNYSGRNAEGETETLRSMKHYIQPREELPTETISVFAPFDGKISEVRREATRGSQVWITPARVRGWQFIFFHIDLASEFDRSGVEVHSGQMIGRVNPESQTNFDMGLKFFGIASQIFDSPFLYMNELVLAEYAARGITKENIIVSKVERDNNPCQTLNGETGIDARFVGNGTSDWVELR